MALTKQEKEQVLSQVREWLEKADASIMVEYTGMRMPDLDNVRAKLRESGGEFHVIKNTFIRKVFTESGYEVPADFTDNSTAVIFAYGDAAATAKALKESTAKMDAVKIKGGYLGKEMLTKQQIIALAELPPLPVMRATLLGVLQAPAGKLVRTVAEPARGLAAVVKAYAEK